MSNIENPLIRKIYLLKLESTNDQLKTNTLIT